jgi:hypothetical protein
MSFSFLSEINRAHLHAWQRGNLFLVATLAHEGDQGDMTCTCFPVLLFSPLRSRPHLPSNNSSAEVKSCRLLRDPIAASLAVTFGRPCSQMDNDALDDMIDSQERRDITSGTDWS